VFGYSVVSLLYQNKAEFGVNAFLGKAVLGLVQAFCFNWIYFEIDGSNLYVHAIRRHVGTSLIWLSAHLPFVMSFVLYGGALSRLVVAHDSPDADETNLTEIFAHKSEGAVSSGLRWFYCAGLAIALTCMGLISASHAHKEIVGQRWEKRYRLAVRFAIAIVLLCLPMAEQLNSLTLISTTTGLVTLVLFLELWGTSCVQDSFFQEKKQCKYTANCKMRKTDLEDAVKRGDIINIEELAEKESGQQGLYELS